jgi:hypothetical protein
MMNAVARVKWAPMEVNLYWSPPNSCIMLPMEARGGSARGERDNGIRKGKTFGALQTPDICEKRE